MAIRLLPRRIMGQTIRGIRNRLGMSQAEFASSLGVESGATVARWERGQSQPDYGTLAKIAAMGVVDVLVFHDTLPAAESPQLTPGEAGELREILARMEALMSDARGIVERAMNRTAVEILEAAAGTPAPVSSADALVLDAELRVETTPRGRAGRSRTASASRRSAARGSTSPRSSGGGNGSTAASSTRPSRSSNGTGRAKPRGASSRSGGTTSGSTSGSTTGAAA